MAINLQPGDCVIAVVPEKAQNPGETDDVVVYIETVGGWLRVETIPPENQSDEMKSIFSVGGRDLSGAKGNRAASAGKRSG